MNKRLAAWNRAKDGEGTCRIYTVGRDTKHESVAELARDEAALARFRGDGLRTGWCYSNADFVWADDEDGFTIWEAGHGRVAHAKNSWLTVGGQSIATQEVVEVAVFDVGNHYDLPYRGVEIRLGAGAWIPIAIEHHYYFQLDPYDYEPDIEHAHVTHLGRDLAARLGVPYREHDNAPGYLDTFDAALSSRLPKLVAWDPDKRWCGIFTLEDRTARLLAQRPVASHMEAWVTKKTSGLRAATCYRNGEYVWAIDDTGCTVWSRLSASVLAETAAGLELPWQPQPLADFIAVQSFSDDDDPDRHGVELVRKAGGYHVPAVSVIEDDDGAWAKDLGQALATRWHLPYRHVCPGGHKPDFVREQAAAAERTTQLAQGILAAMNEGSDE